jgi:hypothetical protein
VNQNHIVRKAIFFIIYSSNLISPAQGVPLICNICLHNSQEHMQFLTLVEDAEEDSHEEEFDRLFTCMDESSSSSSSSDKKHKKRKSEKHKDRQN